MKSTINSFLGNNKNKTYIVLLLCALIIGIKLGTLVPLLALILESRGYNNTIINWNFISQPLAVLLFVRITPIIIHKIGLAKSIIIAQIVTIILYFTFPIFESLTAWFLIRFAIGFAGALAWNAFDTWMLSMTNDDNRGKIISLYNAFFMIGFALGPIILSFTGTEGWFPFIVISSLSFIAILPLILLDISDPELPEKKPLPVIATIFAAPTIFGAAVICGLDDAMFAMNIPLFMMENGFTKKIGLQFITIATVGGIVAQPLIGILLDKLEKRLLMNTAVLIVFVSPILFALNLDSFLIMIISCFIWGGAVSSLFAISLTMLGERYNASQVAGATAILVMIFECGSALGPFIAGPAMDIFGSFGLIYTICSLTFLFLIVSIYRTFRR
tara:strand:- start:855 stop:2015 length:1161 start_codon:yes stop_codon:yes gene_type:complete